ncbi:MAG: Hsp70 family protein [Chloroflexi bacterium]|nr:Hsp70 family protein [Chloroflexota bacterium]
MTRAIGIDLGTTYTVVATLDHGRPRIIPNARGQHLTPSVVSFLPDGTPLVGQPAKVQATADPSRSIASIKRHLGSDYRVHVNGWDYTPVEVSSLILRHVVADAERYLGEPIDRAVITVPAYFNDRQRQATREAATLAGIEVLRLLSEPTATALAYGLQREDAHTVLVWDLGGGTFDVSILDLGDGVFEVRAVSGDTWLGGDDYDRRLSEYLSGEYERLSGRTYPMDAGIRQQLRETAETAKIELSTSERAVVAVPSDARPVDVELTRAQLEHLTADLLQRMVVCTDQALRDAGLTPEDIDRVVLAGGATRMPTLRRRVRGMFGKEPYRYLDPDEVVAMGAAIQAGMLIGLVDKAVLLDVLPLSLGIETQGGLTTRLIPRNTPLPATAGRIFTTAADYQTSMDLHVLQGERALAVDNVSLGQFRLDGLAPAHRGSARVEVSFEADMDGIVHVSAVDLASEHEVCVTVTSTKLLDAHEIARLAEEARSRAEEDRVRQNHIQADIEAASALSAAEMALTSGACVGIQEVEDAASQLREAMATGDGQRLRDQSEQLRRLLGVPHHA